MKSVKKLASKIFGAGRGEEADESLRKIIKDNDLVGFSIGNSKEIQQAAAEGRTVAPKLVQSTSEGESLITGSDFLGTKNKDGTFSILPTGIFNDKGYSEVEHLNGGAKHIFNTSFKEGMSPVDLKDIKYLSPATISADGTLVKKGKLSISKNAKGEFKEEAGSIPEKPAPEPPKGDTSSSVPPKSPPSPPPEPPKGDTSSSVPPKSPPSPPSEPPKVPPKGEGQPAPGAEGTPPEPPPQAKMKQEQQEKLQQKANESKNPPPNKGANNGVGGNSTAGQADNAKKRAGNKNPGAEGAQEGENQPGFFQRHWKATAATIGVGGLAACVGIANMMLAGGQQSNSNLYNPYQQQY